MYLSRIREIIPDHDPRHIEAFMRVEFHSLDHLSEERFGVEAGYAAMCVDEAGPDKAEALAQSFGL